MEFVADLHIHSFLSRATAKNLNLEHLNLWAQLKGIAVIATGDFTNPRWFAELSEKLEPAEEGLFRLKPAFAANTDPMVPAACQGPVRFLLNVEISSIYKKSGKTRKVHNLIFVPTLEIAGRMNDRLGRIGNIASDGRPILGLDSKTLLEIVLEISEEAFVIPAHIWTPWFSVLGSKSGFDAIEECFEDLTSHIFAVETGLSSDPAMNWRVSSLDRFTLVSNSDAHSPSNLGREANLFDTELSYASIKEALKTGDPEHFVGTLEYFAEEGKYHFDGHRKCKARLSPLETMENKGLCPVCGKPVTIGVMYRVEELADRPAGERPEGPHPYTSLLPLTDILSQVFQVGPKSKKVKGAYDLLLERLGPEFEILRKIPLDALERHGPPLLSEALKRMREGRVNICPGYDGEFGKVSLFTEEERHRLLGQSRLFAVPAKKGKGAPPLTSKKHLGSKTATGIAEVRERPLGGHGLCAMLFENLNPAQQDAVRYVGGPLLIKAGPGTGKTLTLTHRIGHLFSQGKARPEQILAVTFTNRAAREMAERLARILKHRKTLEQVTIKTFHALCYQILSHEGNGPDRPLFLINEADQRDLVAQALHEVQRRGDAERILRFISMAKQSLLSPEDDPPASVVPEDLGDDFPVLYKTYQEGLSANDLVDFDDLIFKTVRLFETNDHLLEKYRQRFSFISVDEYQDINYAQYRLIRLLAPPAHDICVIGDPDQAIYAFRGADVRFFQQFCKDYPGAKTVGLTQNYRSTETILQASAQVMADPERAEQGQGIWSGIWGERALTTALLPTEKAEAEYIVKTIEEEVGGTSHFSVDSGRVRPGLTKEERSFSDFAVIFRTKEQAGPLKEAFERSGIPFQSVGHEKLEMRKGIRELIAYLRLGHFPGSDLDLMRVIDFPPRGIGQGTVKVLRRWSERTGGSLAGALDRAGEISDLTPRARERLAAFSEDLKRLTNHMRGRETREQLEWIFREFNIAHAMAADKGFGESFKRLLAMSRPFGDQATDFLANLSVQGEEDLYDPAAERVALMTMHASKGLEFPVLFIAGCEDGLIPFRKKDRDGDLSEERRLFYVALTRAREKIFLTRAKRRLWRGKRILPPVSPYVEAIQQDLKDHRSPFSGRRREERKDSQLSLFQ